MKANCWMGKKKVQIELMQMVNAPSCRAYSTAPIV